MKQRRVINIESGTESSQNLRKNVTLQYYLPSSNGSHISVCKTMFLHTHGMKTDGMVTVYLKKKKSNNGMVNTIDERGRKIKKDEALDTLIKEHVNSFNPQISHYTLSHALKRRYLPPDITIRQMHIDFVQKNNVRKISYEKYRQIFESENIGFSRPNQDECGLFEGTKHHQEELCVSGSLKPSNSILSLSCRSPQCQTTTTVYTLPTCS